MTPFLVQPPPTSHKSLTFRLKPDEAAMGYTSHCLDCGGFFYTAVDALNVRCTPRPTPPEAA